MGSFYVSILLFEDDLFLYLYVFIICYYFHKPNQSSVFSALIFNFHRKNVFLENMGLLSAAILCRKIPPSVL